MVSIASVISQTAMRRSIIGAHAHDPVITDTDTAPEPDTTRRRAASGARES
jgi:hypothetical protein